MLSGAFELFYRIYIAARYPIELGHREISFCF